VKEKAKEKASNGQDLSSNQYHLYIQHDQVISFSHSHHYLPNQWRMKNFRKGGIPSKVKM